MSIARVFKSHWALVIFGAELATEHQCCRIPLDSGREFQVQQDVARSCTLLACT